MARYIDAEPMLREAIEERKFVFKTEDRFKNEIIVRTAYNDLAEFIDKQPTADVVEVKHGEWKVHQSFGCWHYDCPFCDDGYATKEEDKTPPNYCQNCGAKMDGRRRE